MQYFVDSCALPLAALIIFSILIYSQTFGKPRKANPNDAAMGQLKAEAESAKANAKALVASKAIESISASQNALGGVAEYHEKAKGLLFFPYFTHRGIKFEEGANKITQEGNAGPSRRDAINLWIGMQFLKVMAILLVIIGLATLVRKMDMQVPSQVIETVSVATETATVVVQPTTELGKVSPAVPHFKTMYCAVSGPAVLRDENGNEVPNPQGNYQCFVITDEWSQGTVITAPWDGLRYFTLTERSSGRILYLPFDYAYGVS